MQIDSWRPENLENNWYSLLKRLKWEQTFWIILLFAFADLYCKFSSALNQSMLMFQIWMKNFANKTYGPSQQLSHIRRHDNLRIIFRIFPITARFKSAHKKVTAIEQLHVKIFLFLTPMNNPLIQMLSGNKVHKPFLRPEMIYRKSVRMVQDYLSPFQNKLPMNKWFSLSVEHSQ